VIERLVLGRAAALWDGLIPFLGVREHCIDIENHTPERVLTVADDLPQMVFGVCLMHLSLTIFLNRR